MQHVSYAPGDYYLLWEWPVTNFADISTDVEFPTISPKILPRCKTNYLVSITW